MSKSVQLCFQLSIVAATLLAVIFLLNKQTGSGEIESVPTSTSTSSFDMLAYLDDQIACQEDEKDVRCWSSVSKLQMFVAGAPIDHEAIDVRIEQYNKLIDSVWKEAATGVMGEISTNQLMTVLNRKFPSEIDPVSQEVGFVFSDKDEPVLVMQDLVEDYSDTIESWRLLQSWASRKVNASGQLELTPVFSEQAINDFHRFLISFDIALLRRAKGIAEQRKQSVIDAKAMDLAFQSDNDLTR